VRRVALAVLLLLLGLVAGEWVAARAGAPDAPEPRADRAWRLWEDAIRDGSTRVKHWREPQADSIARALVDGNLRAVAAIDSLYRAGAFGPPGSAPALAAAHGAFKRRARGSFDYIAALAADSVVRQSEERELRRPFEETFVNMGAFPIDALARVWLGRDRFRVDYDAPANYQRSSELMIGVPAAVRAEVVRLPRADRRLLCMSYPAGARGTLELLFDSIYRGVVEQRTVIDRGDTLDLVIVRDVEGLYVRRWGLHLLGGVATWRNHAEAPAAPGRIRVGAAAYFPHIELRLPGFLPDLGLDDLRDFHVPRPIWERRYVGRAEAHPPWLGLEPTGAMTDWEAEGPRPRVLEEIFPDL
jgi:hypothetical protein